MHADKKREKLEKRQKQYAQEKAEKEQGRLAISDDICTSTCGTNITTLSIRSRRKTEIRRRRACIDNAVSLFTKAACTSTTSDGYKVLNLEAMDKSRHRKIVGCSAYTRDGLLKGLNMFVEDIASRIYMLD